MKKQLKIYFAWFCLFICSTVYADDPANWVVMEGEPCKLSTPKQMIDDGQGETSVWLELDQNQLLVKTKSTIDTEFNDIGLQVDEEAFLPLDDVQNETNVLFKQEIESIISQFIGGSDAAVHLRFWPTWPTAGLKTVTFSLIGFTKAYQVAGCVMPDSASEGESNEQIREEKQ